MRCPVCRADNLEGPLCRRCKADLVLLFTLEAQRSSALGEAQRALARGDGAAASRHAATAHELRQGADSWQVMALASLLQHDFASAWQCYRRVRAAGS